MESSACPRRAWAWHLCIARGMAVRRILDTCCGGSRQLAVPPEGCDGGFVDCLLLVLPLTARLRMVATADAKRHAAQVVRRLKAAYPDAHCALNFKTPLQLLVATILSAQCTDTRVNIVTKDLFKKYPDAPAFAAAKLPQLERAIQSTGFFRNKAKNIKACCQELVQRYDGRVPQDLGRDGQAGRRGAQDGQRGARHGLWHAHRRGGRHARGAAQQPAGAHDRTRTR